MGRGQRRDHEVGPVDVVAPGEHARLRGAPRRIDDDLPPVVHHHARFRPQQFGVDAVAHRDDDGIGVEDEVGALDRGGPATAALIGLAQLHAHALDRAYGAVPPQELHRRRQVFEVDALFAGVAALFEAAGHLVVGAPVEQRHVFRAQPDGGAHAVHRRVAAAHDDHPPTHVRLLLLPRGQVLGGQIGAHQEVGRAEDVAQLLAREAQTSRGAGALRQKDGVEGAQCVPAHVLPHAHAGAEFDAAGAQGVDLLVDDALGRLEVGDAVAQHAARARPRLEDRHRVSRQAHPLGDGEARRPAPNDRHTPTALETGRGDREAAPLAAVPIGHEGLQLADRDRLGVLAHHAVALAELLLRAEAAAQFRHLAGGAEDGGGRANASQLKVGQRPGDVVADRAGRDTGLGGALDAALRLEHGRLRRVAVVDLVPVVDAFEGRLLRDVVRGDAEPGAAVNRRRVASRGRLGPGLAGALLAGRGGGHRRSSSVQ